MTLQIKITQDIWHYQWHHERKYIGLSTMVWVSTWQQPLSDGGRYKGGGGGGGENKKERWGVCIFILVVSHHTHLSICFSSSATSSIFPRGTGPTTSHPSSSPQTLCPLWLRFQALSERTCFFFFQMIGGWCFYLPGCSPLWSPPHWKTLSRGNQAKRQHAPTRGIFPSIEFRPNFQVYIVAVWGSFINLTLNYPQVAMAMVLMSVQRRLYNSYLEVENDCFAFLDPSHHDIVNL